MDVNAIKNTVKSGIKTTEFWTKLATQLVGILCLFGIFTSAQSESFLKAVEMIVGGITIIIPEVSYAISRAKVKSAPPVPTS